MKPTASNVLLGRLSAEKRSLLALRALKIQEGAVKARQETVPCLPRVEQPSVFPLSFAQERLWFLDQLEPGSAAYNIPGVLRIRGALEADVVEAAVREIVRRHEVLRTRFEQREGVPVQVIESAGVLNLETVDLEAITEAEQMRCIEEMAGEECCQPFDLMRGPMLRMKLARLAKEDHVLFFTMHHIVSDGWSMGVLVKEFGRLYELFSLGQPSPLAELPIQYADYTMWQRGWLQGKVLEKQLSYWKERLAGAPVLDLPTDRPRPAVQDYNGAGERAFINRELLAELNELSRREGATLFMTLSAAFKVLLHRYSGQTDIVVGTPIANRSLEETEGLVGFFVNTLALRTDLSGNPSFKELLKREREVAMGAYGHQDVPFERLVAELHVERNLSRSPLFQVMLNMLNLGDQTLSLPGLVVEEMAVGQIQSKFDLTLYAREQTDGLKLEMVYNCNLFKQKRVEEMLLQLESVLEQAVSLPETSLDDFRLTTQWTKESVLSQLAMKLEPRWELAVHQIFEAQARSSPKAIAICEESTCWTYEELDHRSNRLANYLRAQGMGTRDRVAIYGNRSANLVLAVLGILKAGGSFVILDPSYPENRLKDQVHLARPRGCVHLKGAGGISPELTKCLAGVPQFFSVELPREWIGSQDPLQAYSSESPMSEIRPDHEAYVAFTSGTAGKPKGIIGTHLPLAHFVKWQGQEFGLGPEDRFSMLSGLSHDPLLRDMFTPLSLGARLCIPMEPYRDGRNLAAWVKEQRISVMHLTPALGQLLCGSAAQNQQLPEWLALRYAFFGGDVLSEDVVKNLSVVAPLVQCINFYGTTETPQAMGCYRVGNFRQWQNNRLRRIPIGTGIEGVNLVIINESRQPAGLGELGEIWVRSPYLSAGYLEDGTLNQDRFQTNWLNASQEGRMYRTGDLGRYLPDGNIEFWGRKDHQVKIRGFRVELGEIEAALQRHGSVQQSVAVVRQDEPGEERLVAYVVSKGGSQTNADELKGYLKAWLPEYMVPASIVMLEKLPLTVNGKVDRKALPTPDGRQTAIKYEAPRSELESLIAGVWHEFLKTGEIGIHDNFFDIGGHSLLLVRVQGRLEQLLKRKVAVVDLFQYPTVSRLAECLAGSSESFLRGIRERAERQQPRVKDAVAIIGMVGRFPGAWNLDEFWRNLEGGVESISFFTDAELIDAGMDPQILRNPNYVKARGVLEGTDLFDAGFFGYSPREAKLIDPQHRVFLECAWEAMEHAGYDAEHVSGAIGVFAGMGASRYAFHLLSHPELMSSSTDAFQVMISSDKDFLSTRVSYKLNLKGPSVNVQTACSTSLVAIQMACRSLLHNECDMALAGGVSISAQEKAGYFYQPDGIASPDGHCRAFDARAQGIVRGSGVGIVMLKRLSEALADGDTIHAVIKGSASNNDGALKVGYTAPSVAGQAEVIALAQALSGVEARSISHVEAHGTGTALGDPIEVAALTQAFGLNTKEKGFCAIGSVKSNVGHLDTAAGVAGLIKTVLALKHGKIPASLHFDEPNPKIDFANSPFYVNEKLQAWERNGGPRRAGVSSFGIGGTNAHVVLEESPAPEPSDPARSHQLWMLSARSESALQQATENLAKHLATSPETNLADAAHTLQVGRKGFARRRVLVSAGREQAIAGLEALQETIDGEVAGAAKSVVFLFAGQGAQYEGMGWGVYQQERVFREEVDRCSEWLKGELGLDLRSVMYPGKRWGSGAKVLQQTGLTQTTLFVVEYALAKLWNSWGIEPAAMVGHSLGEYVAACLAGVFTVEEGLKLVAARGRLMGELPGGLMISVGLSEVEAAELLRETGVESGVSIAAINGPGLTVLSGPEELMVKLERELGNRVQSFQRLATSHAFHSAIMDPVVDRFVAEVSKVNLRSPTLPYLSNVTGKWITKEEATDPKYWGRHLRQTVRFSEGIEEILKGGEKVLLEVGPGQTLSSLARIHLGKDSGSIVLSTLRHRDDAQEDEAYLLKTLGRLWISGVKVNWAGFYARERRHRVPLPTYPFERQRYWVAMKEPSIRAVTGGSKRPDINDWFYAAHWNRFVPLAADNVGERKLSWLIFVNENEFDRQLVKELAQCGQDVTIVMPGSRFEKTSKGYLIRIGAREDYEELIENLRAGGQPPDRIVHLWSAMPGSGQDGVEGFRKSQVVGFYSLLYLTQALARRNVTRSFQLEVITSGAQVTGLEKIYPENATVLGLCKVIPQEYRHITCRTIDVVMAKSKVQLTKEARLIATELRTSPFDKVVAYRKHCRWVQTFIPAPPAGTFRKIGILDRLRPRGVYLITGGLGKVGLALGSHLARTAQAKLVLIGRSGLPPKEHWGRWLDTHDAADATTLKILQIQELEKLGAEVSVISADVADEEQMRLMLAKVRRQCGRIHGVIHAAGIPEHKAIQELTAEDCERQFQAKVRGLYVLAKVLKGRQLDFCYLTSSLAAVLGGLGFGAYAAGNLFMDAFAQKQNQKSTFPWISINWDAWEFRTDTPKGMTSMTPAEGLEVFERGLLVPGGNGVVISTQDLSSQINKWINLDTCSENAPATNSPLQLHQRPAISSAYVAPRDETEQQIAKRWQDLLGLETVGVHDDFFELGGHSLLATQLISHVRETFAVELPLRSIFEAPTIAGLAEQIKTILWAASGAPAQSNSDRQEGFV